MFPPRTAVRTIVAWTLACGLLATMTSSAVARPTDDARYAAPTSSLAGTTSKTPAACAPNLPDAASMACLEALTTPRQDLRSPDARDAADTERIAKAMEQYYSTYDEPEPITALAEPAPDDSPFLLISVIAGGLALMVASVALVMRRRHTTRVA